MVKAGSGYISLIFDFDLRPMTPRTQFSIDGSVVLPRTLQFNYKVLCTATSHWLIVD